MCGNAAIVVVVCADYVYVKSVYTPYNDRSISLSSKIRVMRFLVTSIFLYVCESWTLTAELQRRIQAMEMRCYCKILCILYKDTMLPMRKSVPRSNRQSDHMKTS